MVIKFSRITILILLISCGVQKDIPDNISERFTYCYDGNDTRIDSLLKIDGYYVIAESFEDIGYPSMNEDTSYFNILFYENGLCVFNFFPLDNKGQVMDNNSMPLFFKTIIEENESLEASYFYNSRKWGRYIIEGDTIKAQCIFRPKAGETSRVWGINEVWYKIINRTAIIRIPAESQINKTITTNSKNDKQQYLPARFVSVKERPQPKSWLLEEAWFWCKEAK